MYLENAGAGPFAIKSFTPASRDTIQALQSEFPETQPINIGPNLFLKQGGVFWLLRIPKDKITPTNGPRLFQLLNEVDVIIEYCSVYGECWKACSKIGDARCKLEEKVVYEIFNPGFWSRLF